MRRFFLLRVEDVNGNTGTGKVAEGVESITGKTVLFWTIPPCKVAIYDSPLDLEQLHSHEGKTKLIWVDKEHARPSRVPR